MKTRRVSPASFVRLALVVSILATAIPISPSSASAFKVASLATGNQSTTFSSPLPPPSATFTSPLPTPEPFASASPLVLTFRAEPEGVTPGDVITFTLTAANKSGEFISNWSLSATLPDKLEWIPDQPGWAFNAATKRLTANVGQLAPNTSATLTILVRAGGAANASAILTIEAASGSQRVTANAEVWIVQPGRASVTSTGGMLLSPDRRTWVRFAAGGLRSPVEVVYSDVITRPGTLPYAQGRAFEVRSTSAVTLPMRLSVSVPVNELRGNAVTRNSVALFRYDASSERWRKLETRGTQQDDTLLLSATAEEPGVFALATSTSSEMGNYEKPWQPTVRDFQVDLFTGEARYEISLDLPSGRAGQKPPLRLTYSSGLVDALHSDNPQVSWVGVGWNLELGYIARRIDPDDNHVPKCSTDYTLVLNGVSSKLIPIGGDEYRTEDERFWRVQRLTTAPNRGGDYWLVTTNDGIQYRFGYNDETSGERMSAWWMVSPGCDGDPDLDIINWRWNLDDIRDGHDNHVRIKYQVERNNFGFAWGGRIYYYSDYDPCPPGTWWCVWQLNQGYVRGGYISKMDYSRRDGQSDAAYIVHWERAARGDWPSDFDSSTSGIQSVQTFWIKERLSAVEVQQCPCTNDVGTRVRRYELSMDTGGLLELTGVQEVSASGERLPATTFSYHQGWATYSGNCVRGQEEGGWGLKLWLSSVSNGYGGQTGFNYESPQYWSSPFAQSGQILDTHQDSNGRCWYRYRVREATVNPGSGPVMRTVYEYRNESGDTPHNGSWKFISDRGTSNPDDDDYEFRGHPRVRIIQRNSDNASITSATDVWFHQGMGATTAVGICGSDVADTNGLQGREYKSVQYNASSSTTPGTALSQQTQRWNLRDLGSGRRFVSLASACSYPNEGAGPYSQVEYVYDDYGNVTRETRQGNAAKTGDEAIIDRQYAYNSSAWIMNKVTTESVLSGDGMTQTQTLFGYDYLPIGSSPVKGDVTQISRGMGADWAHTYTRYDTWGNPTVVTDALGRVTRTQYDIAYNLYPVVITNALTQTTQIQWDTRLSAPKVITDANNAATRIGHDAFGRVISVTRPSENAPAIKYAYPTGNAVSAPFAITTETRIDTYASAPVYQRAWVIYDGLGRAIQTQAEAENNWLVVQSTAYDARGSAVTVTLPYTLSIGGSVVGGKYITPTWNTLSKTITAYDALGRVTQVTAPDNTVAKRAYQDWRELMLDANNHQTESEKDGLGRLVAVREYYGQYGSPTWNVSETPATTRYWYDARNNLIGVQDALANVTRMSYDALGRKVTMDDPSMGHWEYRYDAVGNLITQTNALSQALVFAYDRLNRVVSKSAGGQSLAQYEYDKGTNGIGHRTAMTDTTGITRWTYDARGRAMSESKTINGAGTFTTGYAYDALDRVITTTYPTNEAVVTTYNKRGLVTGLAGQNVYLTSATYNALGQPLQQNWGNTRSTSYAYWSGNFRLQQLQVSGSLLELRYNYDQVGNVTAITDTYNSGQVQTFGYDARDRLTWARTNAAGNGQYNEGYGYDRMGNIITRTISGAGQTYAYRQPPAKPYKVFLPIVMQAENASYGSPPAAATLHQPFAVISTTAGFRATYDANGNMTLRVEVSSTQRITYTQAWDVENRLSVVTNTTNSQVTRFYYDGDGKRVLQILPGGAKTAYVGALEVSITGTQRITKTYYAMGAQMIAMRVVSSTGNVSYYTHSDHLGSVSVVVNGMDNVASQRYAPYGTLRWSNGSSPTDIGFTGQRADTTGLMFYNARYYSSRLGRFASADTIIPNPATPQLLNRYSYAGNNPILYNDPDGHCGPLCPAIGIAVGIAVVIGVIADLQLMSETCHSTFGHCLLTGLGAGQANLFGLATGQVEPDVTYREYMRTQATAQGLSDGFEVIVPAAILRQSYPAWQRWPVLGDYPEKAWIALGKGYEGHSWGIGQIRPEEARAAGGAGRDDLFDPKASIYYMAYKLGAANAEINKHPGASPLDRFMLLSIAQNSGTGAVTGFFEAGSWKNYLTADPAAANQLWAMLARYYWLTYHARWSLPAGVSLEEYRKTLLEATGGQP